MKVILPLLVGVVVGMLLMSAIALPVLLNALDENDGGDGSHTVDLESIAP